MKYLVEGVSNPFKFAGGYVDASGYEQFGLRYYSPSLGWWTQQDPVGGSLGDLNSANRYVYAGDDPVNLADPSGAITVSAGCIATVITALYALSKAVPAAISAFQGVYYFAAFIGIFNPIIGILVAVIGEIAVAAVTLASGYLLYESVAAACGV